MKSKRPTIDGTRDTLIRGITETTRQVWGLTKRCDQPEGAVTWHLESPGFSHGEVQI